jgi:hypothetical protein
MPTETPQQYTARLLSYTEGRDPLAVMKTTAGRLSESIEGRGVDTLRRRPAAARWSVAEILVHLSDAELVGAWRFRSVLAWNAVPLQPFDQNVWAGTFKYEHADPFAALELFDVVRRSTLALLERVDPMLYDNYGMHAERGKESVRHLIQLYAGHDLNHLAQVERLLQQASGERAPGDDVTGVTV